MKSMEKTGEKLIQNLQSMEESVATEAVRDIRVTESIADSIATTATEDAKTVLSLVEDIRNNEPVDIKEVARSIEADAIRDANAVASLREADAGMTDLVQAMKDGSDLESKLEKAESVLQAAEEAA